MTSIIELILVFLNEKVEGFEEWYHELPVRDAEKISYALDKAYQEMG